MKLMEREEVETFIRELESHLKAVVDFKGCLLKVGDEKIRLVPVEVFEASKAFPGVQHMGLYVAKWRRYPALTIEGCMYLRSVDSSAVVELDREQAMKWMRGGPVEVGNRGRLVVGVYKGFYLGSAVVDRTGRAYPQIPKWRRIPE
jgi:NOL1/NOP2/fmu family ribosome biogenesis protein